MLERPDELSRPLYDIEIDMETAKSNYFSYFTPEEPDWKMQMLIWRNDKDATLKELIEKARAFDREQKLKGNIKVDTPAHAGGVRPKGGKDRGAFYVGGKGRKGVKARSLKTVETYEQDSPVANNVGVVVLI